MNNLMQHANKTASYTNIKLFSPQAAHRSLLTGSAAMFLNLCKPDAVNIGFHPDYTSFYSSFSISDRSGHSKQYVILLKLRLASKPIDHPMQLLISHQSPFGHYKSAEPASKYLQKQKQMTKNTFSSNFTQIKAKEETNWQNHNIFLLN